MLSLISYTVERNRYCAERKLIGGSAALDPPYVFLYRGHYSIPACLLARHGLRGNIHAPLRPILAASAATLVLKS
jgi:hypothetical protein